jgi:hypothetical protein
MNWRPRLQTGLTSLAAAIISLFVIVPTSLAKELTPEEMLNQILLQHPLPRLGWFTWIIIEAQEKGSPPQLEAKLLITVEKGVTKSVAIRQSTGFKAADTDLARWIRAKWRFRPEITRNFTLPVYVVDGQGVKSFCVLYRRDPDGPRSALNPIPCRTARMQRQIF